MNTNVLYVCSSSRSRHLLLSQGGITFIVAPRSSEEEPFTQAHTLAEAVANVVAFKMQHAILPDAVEGQICWVLTADTMCQDCHGTIHGKPTDREDAIQKIKLLRGYGTVTSAFCIDRRRYTNGTWEVEDRRTEVSTTSYIFDIPDLWIGRYLDEFPQFMDTSGGFSVEGYGAQFLSSIQGSYTNILGLPMFEVRQALEHLGFFEQR
jgi:septum formation protein